LKGLDAPEALAERGPGSLYDDLVGAYNECITAAAEARAKADYLKQKDLDRETKAKEKVANLAPADAMKKLVSEAVADQFKKAKGSQKNGQSPGGGRGQNQQQKKKQKSKGQSKGQNKDQQPKGKGKGKGKGKNQNQNNRGKSKGKGKGGSKGKGNGGSYKGAGK
jgi:hypothetical protein